MTTITFCPNCEKETRQEFIRKTEEIDIRGEKVPVELEYYFCEECREEYEIPRPDYDPLENAYREFRKRKGLVQPEEITRFRKKLGLTQKEFSSILSIGIATLNRYENGALQTEAHDRVIQLCMLPDNLLDILEKNPHLISAVNTERLLNTLKQEKQSQSGLLEKALEKFGSYSPSILSGYLTFDVLKFFQIMKFFCYKDQVVKTKLMKLLFYAEFKHFKDHGTSISGTRYAHATHGPVPDNFETWLVAVTDWNKQIFVEEKIFGEYSGEIFSSGEPDWSIFSTSEMAVLAFVKDKFKDFSGSQIREFSHNEKGYKNTQDGNLISYAYARELQI